MTQYLVYDNNVKNHSLNSCECTAATLTYFTNQLRTQRQTQNFDNCELNERKHWMNCQMKQTTLSQKKQQALLNFMRKCRSFKNQFVRYFIRFMILSQM